jgi:hypothetical protein
MDEGTELLGHHHRFRGCMPVQITLIEPSTALANAGLAFRLPP